MQVNNEDAAVITNSHSIRNSNKGKGINFVEPGNVRVTSFYNGMPGNAQVTHEVHRIEKLSRPDKNKERNVLRDAVNKALDGDDTKDSSDIQACKAAVKLLDSYFRNIGMLSWINFSPRHTTVEKPFGNPASSTN